MTKPIKKPSKYFFNQLFLFNPIDDRLLLSITFTLKNTNDDIVDYKKIREFLKIQYIKV